MDNRENEELNEQEELQQRKNKIQQKKKRKGFTLIEILAVIIILGILMIIAVPAVTRHINDSRKSTFVNSAKKFMDAALDEVTDMEYSLTNPDYTYYIPTKCLNAQNGEISAYGELIESYVVVTYNNGKNDYYYTGYDDTYHGVLLTYRDILDEDRVESNIKGIDTTVGVGSRHYIYIYSSDCNKVGEKRNATRNIPENGELLVGESNGTTEVLDDRVVCKRATTLHQSICRDISGPFEPACSRIDSYSPNDTITYGTLGQSGTLTPGDAFDCDVNDDGTYDAETERFYYIGQYGSGSSTTLKFIFYSNTYYFHDELISSCRILRAYDDSGNNWYGPRTIYNDLPKKTDWKNKKLIAPGKRQITNENGGTTTAGGTISEFDYEDRAARLVTYQEVISVCTANGTTLQPTRLRFLKKSNYLMENTDAFDNLGSTNGYWMETPLSSSTKDVWEVMTGNEYINTLHGDDHSNYGVRPVIEVLKNDVEY